MVFSLANALALLSNYTSDIRRERSAYDKYYYVAHSVYRECLSALQTFSCLFYYSVLDNDKVLIYDLNEDYIVCKYLKWFNEYAEDINELDNVARYAFCDAINMCKVLHQAIGIKEKP